MLSSLPKIEHIFGRFKTHIHIDVSVVIPSSFLLFFGFIKLSIIKFEGYSLFWWNQMTKILRKARGYH